MADSSGESNNVLIQSLNENSETKITNKAQTMGLNSESLGLQNIYHEVMELDQNFLRLLRIPSIVRKTGKIASLLAFVQWLPLTDNKRRKRKQARLFAEKIAHTNFPAEELIETIM